MAEHDDQENFSSLPSSQSILPSSPLGPSNRSDRPKKLPPLTPRRFSRFFNPRSSKSSPGKPSRAGQKLRDITLSANNARRHEPDLVDFDALQDPKPRKRRKTSAASAETVEGGGSLPGSSPPSYAFSPRSSPCRRSASPVSEDGHNVPVYCKPIRRAKQQHIYPNWRSQVEGFWTSMDNMHDYSVGDTQDPRSRPMPFCTAACNTNSLVAIGDENGGIRILESSHEKKPPFEEAYVSFSPHSNAIMDLAFSSDDLLLGTASGDQTGRIIDMRTQTTLSILGEHTSSVKQIAFQPGNDNIVATCARNAVVGIWDLRCHGDKPRMSLAFPQSDVSSEGTEPRYGRMVNSIIGSDTADHGGNHKIPATPTARSKSSVTCLSFLSADRPHYFMTATDSTAQISLWDLRQRRRAARSGHTSLPLATTAPLSSHLKNRHYGISSLGLNTDSSRLYSVCKDNTVYVYSMSQLVLGSTPTTTNKQPAIPSTPSATPQRVNGQSFDISSGNPSAKPLYGLRHPSLHVTSFYVRAAIRHTHRSHNGAELLAVGSGDMCAMLFPTNENMLQSQVPDDCDAIPDTVHESLADVVPTEEVLPVPTGHRGTRRSTSGSGCRWSSRTWLARASDDCPIYSIGAPLVKAHKKEVTGLAWASGGELITIGDDHKVFRWRDGGKMDVPFRRQNVEEEICKKRVAARPATFLRRTGLRLQGIGGRRSECGWANVEWEWDHSDG